MHEEYVLIHQRYLTTILLILLFMKKYHFQKDIYSYTQYVGEQNEEDNVIKIYIMKFEKKKKKSILCNFYYDVECLMTILMTSFLLTYSTIHLVEIKSCYTHTHIIQLQFLGIFKYLYEPLSLHPNVFLF